MISISHLAKNLRKGGQKERFTKRLEKRKVRSAKIAL